jgi:hypothetical protein
MREIYGVVMLKSWVKTVCTHYKAVAGLVGLYPAFLPIVNSTVRKWVELYVFDPQQNHPLFPTHIWHFTPVNFYLSTLSTSPIKNSNYVKRINNKGAAWV